MGTDLERPHAADANAPPFSSRLLEVGLAFLKLGLLSFGGPIAHLAYIRAAVVEKRRWIDDDAFADLVALCQFLPVSASFCPDQRAARSSSRSE